MKNLYFDTREMDKKAREKYLLSEELMMENAVLALKENCLKELESENLLSIYRPSILILCGQGNNGADGYALARHLICEKYSITICEFGECKTQIGKLQSERAKKIGVNIINLFELDDFIEEKSIDLKLVVDCIFGIGFHGTLPKEIYSAINVINNLEVKRIACDVPSGLDKFGNVSTSVFNADLTVTMGALKYCLFTSNAKDCAGKIVLADLGINQKNFENLAFADSYLLEKSDMKLPFRKKQNVNKGNFGHLAISLGEKKGAAVIAGTAALKFGCGLVSLVSKSGEEINNPYELMCTKEFPSNTNSVCVGMGLGREENACEKYFDWLLKNKNVPCVLDADSFYSSKIDLFLEQKKFVVLTPHPKEFAVLLKNCGFGDFSVKDVLENSMELVKKFCEKYKDAVLLLKGSSVLIAENSCGKVKIYVNPYGSVALAKAGSGDVLSGMIASLLAQNYDCIQATITASLAHSFASQKVQCNFAMSPFDLINLLTDSELSSE